MNLTEIKEAVEKQPDLKKEILTSFKSDFMSVAESDGLVVRTKEQDQTFLDNHVKTVVDAKVAKELQPALDAEYSKMLTKFDAEIQQITSIEKNTGEKTTAYAKRALSEKHKNADPVVKEKIAELESMLSTAKADYEKQIADMLTKSFTDGVSFQVDAELEKRNIALPAHLKTDAEKQSYINQQKALLKQGFLTGVTPKKDNEGNIVYYEGDKPLMNTKDGKPQTASDIINLKFSNWFIPTEHKITGTGGGEGGGPASGFKNKDDIHKHLASKGLDTMSVEYRDEFEKLATDSKITI